MVSVSLCLSLSLPHCLSAPVSLGGSRSQCLCCLSPSVSVCPSLPSLALLWAPSGHPPSLVFSPRILGPWVWAEDWRTALSSGTVSAGVSPSHVSQRCVKSLLVSFCVSPVCLCLCPPFGSVTPSPFSLPLLLRRVVPPSLTPAAPFHPSSLTFPSLRLAGRKLQTEAGEPGGKQLGWGGEGGDKRASALGSPEDRPLKA